MGTLNCSGLVKLLKIRFRLCTYIHEVLLKDCGFNNAAAKSQGFKKNKNNITEQQEIVLHKHFTEYTNLIYQNDFMVLKWRMKCNHFS